MVIKERGMVNITLNRTMLCLTAIWDICWFVMICVSIVVNEDRDVWYWVDWDGGIVLL